MGNSIKPAFPALDPNSAYHTEGLNMHQYYTGIALQALIAKTPLTDRENGSTQDDVNKHRTDVCESAILYADEILRQLDTKQP